MSVVTGSLTPFQAEDNLEQWLERFEVFLEVNSVEEKNMMRWLIMMCGPIIYDKLKTVCAPDKPLAATYSAVKKKLIAVMMPASDDAVIKTQFFSRSQKDGESCTEFAMALKELAYSCDFGNYRDAAMRDRFQYNLRDPYVRVQMLKQTFESFDAAVEEAQKYEVVQTLQLASSSGIAAVRERHLKKSKHTHKARGKSVGGQKGCFTCGRRGHVNGRTCPAVEYKWECFTCHGVGHTSVVCRSKKSQQSNGRQEQEQKSKWQNRKLHVVETDNFSSDDDEMILIKGSGEEKVLIHIFDNLETKSE